MRPSGWDYDIYRDRIVAWSGEQWCWAQLRPDTVSIVPRLTPNNHGTIVCECVSVEHGEFADISARLPSDLGSSKWENPLHIRKPTRVRHSGTRLSDH